MLVSKVSGAPGLSVHHHVMVKHVHVDVMLRHANHQSHFCSSCRDIAAAQLSEPRGPATPVSTTSHHRRSQQATTCFF